MATLTVDCELTPEPTNMIVSTSSSELLALGTKSKPFRAAWRSLMLPRTAIEEDPLVPEMKVSPLSLPRIMVPFFAVSDKVTGGKAGLWIAGSWSVIAQFGKMIALS